MTDAITLPQLGESVTEGVITAWLVEVGDHLEVDQPVAEISTDKVDTEIPSPVAGRVQALCAAVDETVEVGQVIAEIATDSRTDGDKTSASASLEEPDPRIEVDAADGSATTRLSPKVRRLLRERSLDPGDVVGTGNGGRITPADVEIADAPTVAASPAAGVVASPLVRSMLRQAGLSTEGVPGTGVGGRVTRDDASAAIASASATATSTSQQTPPQGSSPAATPSARDGQTPSARSETVTLTRIRRTVADHMHRSLQTTAQLTSVVEVDMTRLMAIRARTKDAVRSREGVSLTPLALTARVVCDVLARHPVLNAQIDMDAGTATYHYDVNLGIAVDTEAGLIVPTIHGAQELTVPALARRIADLAERSRSRNLSPDDVAGGTFTITNTGSRGVLLDTPILNPPQVAILATTLIEKRPVVVTDEFGMDALAIRQMSYLCLTYDHRLVDGADAARFLNDLKHTLETRELLSEFAD